MDDPDIILPLHPWPLSDPSGTSGESGDFGSDQVYFLFDLGHYSSGLFIEGPGFPPQRNDPQRCCDHHILFRLAVVKEIGGQLFSL